MKEREFGKVLEQKIQEDQQQHKVFLNAFQEILNDSFNDVAMEGNTEGWKFVASGISDICSFRMFSILIKNC